MRALMRPVVSCVYMRAIYVCVPLHKLLSNLKASTFQQIDGFGSGCGFAKILYSKTPTLLLFASCGRSTHAMRGDGRRLRVARVLLLLLHTHAPRAQRALFFHFQYFTSNLDRICLTQNSKIQLDLITRNPVI